MKTINLSHYEDVFDASDVMIANIKECLYGIRVCEKYVFYKFFQDVYGLWRFNKGKKIYRIPSIFLIRHHPFNAGILAEPEILLALPKFQKEQFVFEKGKYDYRLRIREMSEILLGKF